MLLDKTPDPHAPPRGERAWLIQIFFWIFMLAFAFDYRADEPSGISQLFQFGFLGIGLMATACLLLVGYPYLTGRPGAWFLMVWGLFLAFMFGNAILQGVPPGRFLRTGLPFLLSFAAMLNSHIAVCAGIRVSHLAAPIFLTAIINVIWRLIYGLLFKGVTVDTVRVEILSPALGWMAAFIGVSLLLRTRFHWSILLAVGAVFPVMMLSVTRSLLFPMAASALVTSICFTLGFFWGAFQLRDLFRKLFPIAAAGMGAILLIIGVFIIVPSSMARWQERLFSPTNDRNMISDPSLLTRQAEAKAIFDILDRDPIHYINGKGVGASLYWDDDYFPELYQVYDQDDLELMSSDIWYAGHSIWTYSLFCGGFIALFAFIALFVTAIVLSIASAAANASRPGPDYWLLFLPAVVAVCILSESATSNPFDERLLGMLFGSTFSFSQAGFVRASWMKRNAVPTTTPKSPII